MNGAIGLELEFGFLASGKPTSTSFLARKYNTFVDIDGYVYEREGGAWHVFPLVPGWHLVRVYFKVRPSFLSTESGAEQLQVLVEPNAMSRLKYSGGAFWPMTSGSLVRVG